VRGLNRTGKLALSALALLILLAPLPEGSAYPWALAIVEASIFVTAALCGAALALGKGRAVPPSHSGVALALVFVALVAIQLVPLPPALLKVVSPNTYRLYALSMPGWPHARAGELPAASRPSPSASGAWTVLPTMGEIAAGAAVAFAPLARAAAARSANHSLNLGAGRGGWRGISIAPSITRPALLEMVAYLTLFLVVFLCPVGADAQSERAVARTVMLAVLISGLIVAVVGVVEFFDWNGKILWLFVPYDWGAPQLGAPARAFGPFVSPDHFGDYLVQVLPLAVGGAMFRSDLFSKLRAFRVFSALTAFFVVCALLLSLSRGAWIAGAIALAALFVLSARMPARARPRLPGFARAGMPSAAGVLAAALVVSAFVFIGAPGRRQIDLRLQETVYDDSGFGGRLGLAADTLAMARDYPVLGVGLGCWPELFPHYRRPPWAPVMYREAHNDYAQLLAETGIAGFALVACFFAALGRQLYRGLANGAPLSPELAAVCAALAAVAFHEFFDFSLRTPANAILFTTLLALAARMAGGGRTAAGVNAGNCPRSRRIAGACATAAAAGLALCALAQEKTPYPYNIARPASQQQALALISAHPAESTPHLELLAMAGARMSQRRRLEELDTALWLDPTNPYPRDLHAQALLRRGMGARALDDITRSVADSPSLSTHSYLNRRLIQWLSAAERAAVERGFKEAVGRGYDGAVPAMADFYGALDRFGDAAQLYRKAADRQHDPDVRESYLLGAGVSYARAGNPQAARESLAAAIRVDPADTRPYEYLVTMVYGPRDQLGAARNVVAKGIRAGADGGVLYQALADAAQHEGNTRMVEIALRGAVDSRPTYNALLRLGIFYLNQKKYDRAALNLRRATEVRSAAAEAHFYLGLAEESDYRFSDAERDLARALQLAPANPGYRAHYLDFQRRVAQGLGRPLSTDR
jgi:O-antigen ligase/tetratricopeptide (TPR) repeat protein